MLDFTSALDTKMEEIERPPLAPIGTYIFMSTELPRFDTVGDGAWDVCEFQMQAIQATDEIDADELAAFGDIKNIKIRLSFMFDKQDEFKFKQTLDRLKRFIEDHLQVDGADSMSIKEALNATLNHQCKGVVQHRPDKNDPEVAYAEIRKTAPVD